MIGKFAACRLNDPAMTSSSWHRHIPIKDSNQRRIGEPLKKKLRSDDLASQLLKLFKLGTMNRTAISPTTIGHQPDWTGRQIA